jgi:hypothetical protein
VVTDKEIILLDISSLTRCTDECPVHAGILAVYHDNDPVRDMRERDMAQAIANLESAGMPIAGAFWVLNAYRWQYSISGG